MSKHLHDLDRVLTQLYTRLQQQLATQQTDSVGALSAYDNHSADAATDTAQRELALGLANGLERRLTEVARAKAKLQAGSYGRCDRCGAQISAARLRAQPAAIYCTTCQARQDAEDAVNRPELVDTPDVSTSSAMRQLIQWGNSDTPQDVPPAIDYQQT